MIMCLNPMLAEQRGFTQNGKPNYVMLPLVAREQYDPRTWLGRYVTIPCKQCWQCRLDYSREWANRMICEIESQPESERLNNYFVTLTYDPQHLPYVSDNLGIDEDKPTLVKSHVSMFIKRLRNYFPNSTIRFYASGEYGDKNGRPHYHLIIFGLPLDRNNEYHLHERFKREISYKDPSGILIKERVSYYDSPLLEHIWSDDGRKKDNTRFGMVCVNNCNWKTCAYVARYVTKKLTGKENRAYTDYGIQAPFSLSSRRPGIGAAWFDGHIDYLRKYTEICFPSTGRQPIPKYFKRLYECNLDEEYPFKASDKLSMFISSVNKLSSSGKSLPELCDIEADKLSKKILPRLDRHSDF